MSEGKSRYLICPSCTYFCRREEDAQFCPSCGMDLIDGCPNCQEGIDNPYAHYCKHCGKSYPGRTKTRKVSGKETF